MARETASFIYASGRVTRGDGETAWSTREMIGNDGKTWTVGFPPGQEYWGFNPQVGQEIKLFKNTRGWQIDSETATGKAFKPKGGGGSNGGGYGSNSGGAPSGGGNTSGGGGNSREEYWTKKDSRDENWQNYQIGTRDPKIEWQSHFNNISNIYAACLGNLTNPPTQIHEIDALIDDIVAKTDAVFRMKNPK